MVEAQIGQQTGLVAVRTLRRVGLDERLRQSLSEDNQLVHITLQRRVAVDGSADAGLSAADAAQAVGSEGRAQLRVHVDVGHVVGAVHRHGIVVPLVVAPVASQLSGKAVRAERQRVGFESDVKAVAVVADFLQALAVAQQRTAALGVGLEPEHQRVVLLGRAVDGFVRQLQAFVLLVQVQRHSTRYCPAGAYQLGIGTLSVVNGIVARAFVHRVVVYQVLLVARQPVQAVGAHESGVHGAIPQASLHHAALVVLDGRTVSLVGAAEDERAGTVVQGFQLVALADGLTVAVEPQRAVLLADADSHLAEAALLDGRLRLEGLLVDHGSQLLVLGQPELQLLAVGAVREERHVAVRSGGVHPHFDGQVLAGEVALGLRLHAGLSGELQAHILRDVIVVHLAPYLEVAGGAQVVVVDVLREVEHDVVVQQEQSALRFGCAEQLRATRVLDTADNLRRRGEECSAVAAEEHGPQVVAALHLPAVAVELGDDVGVGLHQLAHTVGLGHQC